MGFIERTYTSTMALLDSLGQTQFEAVASQIGTTAQILSALVVVLVLFNMALQIRPMEAGTSVWLIFKLVLVALFMQSWTDFNGVFDAIETGFEAVGNALLAGGLGDGETETSFPQELDNLSLEMGQYANVTAGRMNILGSVINGLMFMAIAVFGALATLAMVASRVVLAVLVGLAPLAILATLTTVTKSYFDTWLSGVIKVLMYPLILIGIFATILGMGNATISGIDPDDVSAIGQVTPILTVLVLACFLVLLSPLIVTLVAGDFALGAVTALASGALKRAGGSMARGAGGAARGAMGMDPAQPRSAAERGAAIGSGARNVASDTAGFLKNPVANTREGVNLRAAQINRAAERVTRLRRK
ncbi:type IV secretion system protein [Roseovarius aestuarii]|nr:type IV secretion system protein [Roseovarius aestuarii]